jgi:hypothetical protein
MRNRTAFVLTALLPYRLAYLKSFSTPHCDLVWSILGQPHNRDDAFVGVCSAHAGIQYEQVFIKFGCDIMNYFSQTHSQFTTRTKGVFIKYALAANITRR